MTDTENKPNVEAAQDAQPTHKSIASALARAQAKMGKALKTSLNPAFKGDGKPKGTAYADLASVVDACMPALNECGIAVIQPTTDDDSGRYVETILIHGDSGEMLKCRVPLIVAKNDMQGYGSAVTYARRYGLMSMAGIAPEDDDGNAAAQAAPRNEPKTPAGPHPAATRIKAAIAKRTTRNDLGQLWKDEKEALANLPDADFESVKAAFGAAMSAIPEDKPSDDLGDDIDDEIPF